MSFSPTAGYKVRYAPGMVTITGLKILARILYFAFGLVFKIIFRPLRFILGGWRGRSKTFGSARWATLFELIRAGVWGREGLILGKYWGRFIRFNRQGYILLFAPSRTGKGVSVVVPNLLSHKGSVICTDPKGENYAITARRRQAFGPVFTLNAIHPELSDRFNPLEEMVRVGTFHEVDDAEELAKLLVLPEAGGHWDTRATQFLKTIILYVCRRYADEPENRNLSKVRTLVSLGAGVIDVISEDVRDMGSISLRESVQSIKQMADTAEGKAIFSNVDKAMDIWSADRPAGILSAKSTFKFRDFNRQTMSCYLMVDEGKLKIYGSFLRVMMGCAIIAMTRAKDEAPPEHRTLFLLDECAAMGYIEPIETGVGYLAIYSYLILVFQDLDQLRKTYRKYESIISNASIKQAFGVNDLPTANMLSEMIGNKTVRSRSAGHSQTSSDPLKRQQSESVNEAARRLLDASEILRLPAHQALIFFNGGVVFPVLARKVTYYKERCWKGMWDEWRPKRGNILPFPSLPTSSQDDEAA